MKLYSGPLSLFTAKVRIALDEKSISYDRVEVGWSREHRYLPHHPEVVALNPRCQIPVLVDEDVVVYDSTVILEYLEDRYPEPALYPKEAASRARCRQLEAAADEIVFPHVWSLIDGSFYPEPALEGSSVDLSAAQAGLCEQYEILDKDLDGRNYLCEEFSVADIGSFIMVFAASSMGAPVPPALTRLGAWIERVGERPAVQREVAAMGEVSLRALSGSS